MGKYDKTSNLNVKSRLSGIKKPTKSENEDARLKLTQKANLDARDLLKKKQEQKIRTQNTIHLIKKTLINNTEPESSNLVKIIKNEAVKPLNKHVVTTNRSNTMITLKNDRIGAKSNGSSDDGGARNARKAFNEINKSASFRIKVENKPQLISTISSDKQSNVIVEKKNNLVKKQLSDLAKLASYDEEKMDLDEHDGGDEGGFRLLVSNLHPDITEGDVLELFSSIGTIKRARFLKKCVADVIYVRLEDAKKAIDKFSNQIIDGKPLIIELVTKIPISEKVALFNSQKPSTNTLLSTKFQQHHIESSSHQPHKLFLTSSSSQSSNNSLFSSNLNNSYSKISNRFKTLQQSPSSPSSSNQKVIVDTSVIHQALFKGKDNNSSNQKTSNPVTFTVKL